MFPKGSRVMFPYKGGAILGTVVGKTPKGIKVKENGKDTVYTIPMHLSHLLKPAVFDGDPQATFSFKKGDKVQFLHNYRCVCGVVNKVTGGFYHIIEWENPDNIWKVPVGDSTLKEGNMEDVFHLPANSAYHMMSGYEVRKYQSYPRMSEETIAFNAEIWFDGTKIATAENGGKGGSTILYGDRNDIDKFMQDAEEWVKSFGIENPIEAYGTFIHWFVNERPYGVSAKLYFERYKAASASLENPTSPA